MRRVFYALLIAAMPVQAATASVDILAALKSLQADDARVLAIGYRLATSNAPFCQDALPASGLLLLDSRGFNRPDEVRAALGITGDFAVEAVAPGSPADKAGVKPWAEVLALDGQQLGLLPASRVNDFARLVLIHDRLDAALSAKGKVILGLPGVTVELAGTPACRSRYELLTEGKGAAADGKRVRISRALLNMARSDHEAAFVIAHELAHNVLAHPSTKGRKASAIRLTEREADRLSLWLMANAGFDPLVAPEFLRRWGSKGLAALFTAPTHDRAETRAKLIEQELAVLTGTAPGDHELRDWRSRFSPDRSSRQKAL